MRAPEKPAGSFLQLQLRRLRVLRTDHGGAQSQAYGRHTDRAQYIKKCCFHKLDISCSAAGLSLCRVAAQHRQVRVVHSEARATTRMNRQELRQHTLQALSDL